MNVLKRIKEAFMNLIEKYNVKNIPGMQVTVSNEMTDSINLWAKIATGSADWNDEAPSCGIPAAIAGALADPVDEEMSVTAEDEALQDVMKLLDEKSNETVYNIVQYGGELIRPVYAAGRMSFEIVRLGNYLPTAYDFNGELTGAIITKKLQEGKKSFLLVEQQEFKNNTHTVKVKLYRIDNGSLTETPLTSCSMTAGITPEYSWQNVARPMLVEIRNRKQNNIDGSHTPCAIYSGYENLIEDADRQYWRMNWEQEAGETRLFADSDLFMKPGTNKESTLPKKLARLITKVEGNGTSEEKIHTHAPALRTTDQTAAFNEILRRIELACNIGKGTLSNLENQQQTATQYTGGKKALYSAVDTIESELEAKYKDAAEVFAHIISAYENRAVNPEITVTFNDAARKDPAQMKQQALQEVNAGIMSREEYRMIFYGEDQETAAAKIPPAPEMGGFVL